MKQKRSNLLFILLVAIIGSSLLLPGIAYPQTPSLTITEQELKELEGPLPDKYEKGSRWFALDYKGNQIDAKFGYPFGVALQKGRYFVLQKRYKEACDAFAIAAKIRPEAFPFDEWGDILEAMGDHKQAITVYRQAVYNAGLTPQGQPVHDFMEEDGSSVYAKVQSESTTKEKWRSDIGEDTAVLMRYALLLEQHKRYEEALVVYEWGRKRTFAMEGSNFGQGVLEDHLRLGPMFALEMTRTTMKYSISQRAMFEAAAHTLMGYRVNSFRTMRNYYWPDYVRIPEYKKALALQPDFAPAKLFLAIAYLNDPELRPEGIATLHALMDNNVHPGIRMRATEKSAQVYKEEEERQAALRKAGTQTP